MTRLTRSLAVTIAALTFMLVAWAGAAQAHRDTVVGPGDSIQAAVDAAHRGDIIRVFGEHRENVVIQKDGLTLRGAGAIIRPPATPAANACFDPTVAEETVKGICVSGDVDFDTGAVSRVVSNVTISGFTVRDFTGAGIAAVAARDTTLKGNIATDNGEGGIAAIVSTGTRMLFNRASGGDAAAFSVVLSPTADATLFANEAQDSRFGILINDAQHGRIVANSVHDNCVGVLVAAAPGTAGEFRIAANHIRRNTRACPATADFPALSGAGVALFGATANTVVGNLITRNVPTGETLAAGGVAVIEGGTPPTGNVVKGNRILRNDPDLFWDQTGIGNVFRDNLCRTSTPPNLCR
jgi:nitrous oxidase accessory protein NosD